MLLLFGSITRRSPIPRPGMLPPTLNGRGMVVNEAPWLVDLRMAPLFGSQEFVYIPTARYLDGVDLDQLSNKNREGTYRLLVFTGSVARASMPQSCLHSSGFVRHQLRPKR